MPSPQSPISSGFGMRSEPSDVLDGIDLTRRHVVFTGGYSGLGLETAPALAGAGAAGVDPHAIDLGEADRLWALSADLTGVDAFA